MRTVIRNSFARQTILSERVKVRPTNPIVGFKHAADTCAWCGQQRVTLRGADLDKADGDVNRAVRTWLYRFHVEGDSSRDSGPIADGRLFCSRSCAESFTDRSFDEGKR